MTKEEAIKAIKANYPSGGYERLCEALDMAIEALDDSRWIPVTERLPDEEGAYIVTVRDIFGNGYVTREWFYGNEWSYSFVTAWMPLLEPYKAESEEGAKG